MIETIVIKIGKVILSKLIYIGIGFLLALLLFATLCQPKPQAITFYSTDTLTEYIYKDTTIIADTVYIEGKIIYIDSSTTMAEIPIRTHIQNYMRILISGKEIFQLYHTIETDYRGIIYAQRMNPVNDTFTIKVPGEKSIRLCGSVGLGYLNQGNIYAPAKIGLMFKDRISVSGVAGYCNGEYVGGLLEAHF